MPATPSGSQSTPIIGACPVCGATNPVRRFLHIGGYATPQPVYQCEDSVACWARWDAAHGLSLGQSVAMQAVAARDYVAAA